ncbi:hypothetical protein Tco_0915795, partial [Tanacetum coccineum]
MFNSSMGGSIDLIMPAAVVLTYPVFPQKFNVDHVFEADECDAFNSDVDEGPTIQTMFMVNLTSEDPIYDEVGPLYDSNTPFEVQDHDTFVNHMDEYHEVHEMQSDVQHNYVKLGSDEIEPTNEETSNLEETNYDDEQEIGEIFKIETNLFDYETSLCEKFKEFNYLLKIDPDVLTKDTEGFKIYEEYKDDWIYEWNKDVPWSGLPVAGEKMDIVIEETCPEPTCLEIYSIIKTLN